MLGLVLAAIGCGDDKTGSASNGNVAGMFGGVGGTAGTPASGGAGGAAGTGTPAGAGGTAGVAGVGGAGGTAGVGATGGTGGTAGTAPSGGTGGTAGTAGMTGGAAGVAGMMTTGGAGGESGQGGAGGDWTMGAMCADQVLANAPEGSTSPECAACLCEKCPTELGNCYPADDATWSGQCRALVQCGRSSPCCGKSCYGNYDFVTMTGDGPCVQEVYDAGGGKAAVEGTPGSCSMFGPPPANACAASNRFGLCTATNCKAECNSPCNPVDFN